MKKFVLLAVLTFSICFAGSFTAFAGSLCGTANPVEVFSITGGIDMDKDTETTFDKIRNIIGKAEKGTDIVIKVYTPSEEGYSLMDTYETCAGVSELFSQTIDLYIGENYITVEAYGDGDCYSKAEAYINRKKSEIKEILQQGIVLPVQRG